MRVRLKGINRASMTLADGRVVTYYYAWKGGPRLRGEPGSPEFHASYNEAVTAKIAPPAGVLLALTRWFEETSEFVELADRTKADYRKKLAMIERDFGDLPLAALDDKRTRGIFKEWRSKLAKSSKRQADYAWVVLARLLSVAKDYGKIATNPCEKGGRLYSGSRRDLVWSLDDEKAYLASAPEHMRLPLLPAVWTAQRQGDLVRLPWSGYDGKHIRLRQRKTGARVAIPVVGPLKEALDAAAKRKAGPLILTTKEGRPWTEDGFRSSWGKARDKAGPCRSDVPRSAGHRGDALGPRRMLRTRDCDLCRAVARRRAVDTRQALPRRDAALADSAGAKIEKWSRTGTDSPK